MFIPNITLTTDPSIDGSGNSTPITVIGNYSETPPIDLFYEGVPGQYLVGDYHLYFPEPEQTNIVNRVFTAEYLILPKGFGGLWISRDYDNGKGLAVFIFPGGIQVYLSVLNNRWIAFRKSFPKKIIDKTKPYHVGIVLVNNSLKIYVEYELFGECSVPTDFHLGFSLFGYTNTKTKIDGYRLVADLQSYAFTGGLAKDPSDFFLVPFNRTHEEAISYINEIGPEILRTKVPMVTSVTTLGNSLLFKYINRKQLIVDRPTRMPHSVHPVGVKVDGNNRLVVIDNLGKEYIAGTLPTAPTVAKVWPSGTGYLSANQSKFLPINTSGQMVKLENADQVLISRTPDSKGAGLSYNYHAKLIRQALSTDSVYPSYDGTRNVWIPIPFNASLLAGKTLAKDFEYFAIPPNVNLRPESTPQRAVTANNVIVSCNGHYDGWPIQTIFQRTAAGFLWSPSIVGRRWITFEFPDPIQASGYYQKLFRPDYATTAWEIHVSMDGVNWTFVHSKTIPNNNDLRFFELPKTLSFKFLRFEATAFTMTGGIGWLEIVQTSPTPLPLPSLHMGSVATNQFSLLAGKYRVFGELQFARTSAACTIKARLRNVDTNEILAETNTGIVSGTNTSAIAICFDDVFDLVVQSTVCFEYISTDLLAQTPMAINVGYRRILSTTIQLIKG